MYMHSYMHYACVCLYCLSIYFCFECTYKCMCSSYAHVYLLICLYAFAYVQVCGYMMLHICVCIYIYIYLFNVYVCVFM